MAGRTSRRRAAGFGQLLRRVEMLGVLLSGCALTGMAYMITIDVGLRYLFSAPLPASVEISQLLQPYVIFLPMAYTLAVGRHVQVTMVTMMLPTSVQLVLQAFVLIVDAAFFAAITWFAWGKFYDSYVIDEIMLAAVKLPWWVGKFAMPLGLLIVILECAVQLASLARRAGAAWHSRGVGAAGSLEAGDCQGGDR